MVFELSAHTTSTLLLTSTRATWPTEGCRANRTGSEGQLSKGEGRGTAVRMEAMWVPARDHREY